MEMQLGLRRATVADFIVAVILAGCVLVGSITTASAPLPELPRDLVAFLVIAAILVILAAWSARRAQAAIARGAVPRASPWLRAAAGSDLAAILCLATLATRAARPETGFIAAATAGLIGYLILHSMAALLIAVESWRRCLGKTSPAAIGRTASLGRSAHDLAASVGLIGLLVLASTIVIGG